MCIKYNNLSTAGRIFFANEYVAHSSKISTVSCCLWLASVWIKLYTLFLGTLISINTYFISWNSIMGHWLGLRSSICQHFPIIASIQTEGNHETFEHTLWHCKNINNAAEIPVSMYNYSVVTLFLVAETSSNPTTLRNLCTIPILALISQMSPEPVADLFAA